MLIKNTVIRLCVPNYRTVKIFLDVSYNALSTENALFSINLKYYHTTFNILYCRILDF